MLDSREKREVGLSPIFLVQAERLGNVSEVGSFHHSVFHRVAKRLLFRLHLLPVARPRPRRECPTVVLQDCLDLARSHLGWPLQKPRDRLLDVRHPFRNSKILSDALG
jgi:hypothetical protein